ncbi:MAG: hypothetical protein CVU11_15895 [Bacteroidetes bacterium HGW-Bacteroidetes-6]|jgi:hypothetical protein|nr:MAG: hypothetical protein CVU11_15895 [Bacteroidetes bacterium HGW-Bacteroidetes-6]
MKKYQNAYFLPTAASLATKPSQGFNGWFGNNPVRVTADCPPQQLKPSLHSRFVFGRDLSRLYRHLKMNMHVSIQCADHSL